MIRYKLVLFYICLGCLLSCGQVKNGVNAKLVDEEPAPKTKAIPSKKNGKNGLETISLHHIPKRKTFLNIEGDRLKKLKEIIKSNKKVVNKEDPCLYNPCLHRGLCHNNLSRGPESYICLCTVGYSGSRCQNEVPVCGLEPCENGQCLSKLDGSICRCLNGFKQFICQTTGRHSAVSVNSMKSTMRRGGYQLHDYKKGQIMSISIGLGILITLVLCCLLQACRTWSKRSDLRYYYKENLKNGVDVPVPPETLEICQQLCLETFCSCGSAGNKRIADIERKYSLKKHHLMTQQELDKIIEKRKRGEGTESLDAVKCKISQMSQKSLRVLSSQLENRSKTVLTTSSRNSMVVNNLRQTPVSPIQSEKSLIRLGITNSLRKFSQASARHSSNLKIKRSETQAPFSEDNENSDSSAESNDGGDGDDEELNLSPEHKAMLQDDQLEDCLVDLVTRLSQIEASTSQPTISNNPDAGTSSKLTTPAKTDHSAKSISVTRHPPTSDMVRSSDSCHIKQISLKPVPSGLTPTMPSSTVDNQSDVPLDINNGNFASKPRSILKGPTVPGNNKVHQNSVESSLIRKLKYQPKQNDSLGKSETSQEEESNESSSESQSLSESSGGDEELNLSPEHKAMLQDDQLEDCLVDLVTRLSQLEAASTSQPTTSKNNSDGIITKSKNNPDGIITKSILTTPINQGSINAQQPARPVIPYYSINDTNTKKSNKDARNVYANVSPFEAPANQRLVSTFIQQGAADIKTHRTIDVMRDPQKSDMSYSSESCKIKRIILKPAKSVGRNLSSQTASPTQKYYLKSKSSDQSISLAHNLKLSDRVTCSGPSLVSRTQSQPTNPSANTHLDQPSLSRRYSIMNNSSNVNEDWSCSTVTLTPSASVRPIHNMTPQQYREDFKSLNLTPDTTVKLVLDNSPYSLPEDFDNEADDESDDTAIEEAQSRRKSLQKVDSYLAKKIKLLRDPCGDFDDDVAEDDSDIDNINNSRVLKGESIVSSLRSPSPPSPFLKEILQTRGLLKDSSKSKICSGRKLLQEFTTKTCANIIDDTIQDSHSFHDGDKASQECQNEQSQDSQIVTFSMFDGSCSFVEPNNISDLSDTENKQFLNEHYTTCTTLGDRCGLSRTESFSSAVDVDPQQSLRSLNSDEYQIQDDIDINSLSYTRDSVSFLSCKSLTTDSTEDTDKPDEVVSNRYLTFENPNCFRIDDTILSIELNKNRVEQPELSKKEVDDFTLSVNDSQILRTLSKNVELADSTNSDREIRSDDVHIDLSESLEWPDDKIVELGNGCGLDSKEATFGSVMVEIQNLSSDFVDVEDQEITFRV